MQEPERPGPLFRSTVWREVLRERATRGQCLMAAAGLLSSALFMVLVLRGVELGELLRELNAVSLGATLGALGLALVGIGLMGWRSGVLLAPVARARHTTLLRSVLVGIVGNNLLPLRLGEVLRVSYLAQQLPIPVETLVAVVIVERLLDVIVLLAVLAVVLALGWLGESALEGPLRGAVALGVSAAFGLTLLGLLPRLRAAALAAAKRALGETLAQRMEERAERFVQGVAALGCARGAAAALCLTLGHWGSAAAIIQLWISAFGLELPGHACVVVLLFLCFGVTLPSSPAFVGPYHFFVASALRVFDVPVAAAASLAIVMHAVATLPLTAIGGLALGVEQLVRRGAPARMGGPRSTAGAPGHGSIRM